MVQQFEPSGTQWHTEIQLGREWIGPQTPCGLTWTPSSSASEPEAFLQLSTSTTMCLANDPKSIHWCMQKLCKIVVNLGKSMYCKSNDIPSCRDGVHCITTSGKSCDGLLLGLPDEWAIQCAMRMEHQFEGIWSHPSNLCVSRKRQCECVTVCYWNILNSFETSKKWDMLFPASLFTEAYWKGLRFHPSTFVALRIPRTSTAWHHIPVLSCSARLTRSRPDATDGRCCETIFPGKAWHFETWSFSYFSCNSEALLNIHEYPGDFKIWLMLNDVECAEA